MKQAIAALPTIEFDSFSLNELRLMSEGAEQVKRAHHVLKKGGLNIVGECLKGQGTFFELEHYPKGDVFDAESFVQYYYHAHREDREEHGHFHTFMRAGGMPPAVKPVEYHGDVKWQTGDDAISHMVCISMNNPGFPTGLFATNRWVTGETWYSSSDVISMIDGWQIDHAYPNLAVNHWITGMVKLFKPQIIALLVHRDQVIESWQQKYPDQDVYEDRSLEVTGEYDISVESQCTKVENAIEKLNAS